MNNWILIIALLGWGLLSFVVQQSDINFYSAKLEPIPLTKLCLVTEVYDGDTITVDMDLLDGEIILKDQSIRLLGIDAPEMRGDEREDGIVIRDLLREKILNRHVLLETHGRGKYGRILGVIYSNGENLNEWLLQHELVEAYEF